MVADRAGNVHVAWSALAIDGLNETDGSKANTVYYTMWNGAEWSIPVDVLAGALTDQDVEVSDIFVSDYGTIGIIWHSKLGEQISLSKVGDASDAKHWTTAATVPTATFGTMQILPNTNRWIFAYIDDLSRLQIQASDSSGRSWSSPQEIWSVPSSDSAIMSLRSAMDTAGRVHLVWTETASQYGWNGTAIWYARQVDPGNLERWEVREVKRRLNIDDSYVGWPAIAVTPTNQVHLVWSRRTGDMQGRFHQWSQDGGETWSEPKAILPGVSGMTYWNSLVADQQGVVHLLTFAHYATWRNGTWSDSIALLPQGETSLLALTHGNRLHAIWNSFVEDQGGHVVSETGIMYSSKVIPGPTIVPQGFRQSVTEPLPTVTPSPEVSPLLPIPSSETAGRFGLSSQNLSRSSLDPSVLTALGVLPTVLFVLIILVINIMRSRQA
jgi:hypothetical protein